MARDRASILLVSDDASDVARMARSLHRLVTPANDIHRVRDGEEALDFLFFRRHYTQPDRPHIVFLDMSLPKMSGMDVLWVLKTDERTHSIPVVALTSSQQETDSIEKSGLNADGYIAKPVTFEALDKAMRHLHLFWLLVPDSSPVESYTLR